jgi:DNA polymerase I-like protein with 3'-5' exonuclease and polymerase domains
MKVEFKDTFFESVEKLVWYDTKLWKVWAAIRYDIPLFFKNVWRFRKELEGQYGKDQVMQAYRDYRNGLNNCLNFQLQSLAAAVVNRAALKINLKAKELGIDAIVQAQVHDQLIINVDEKDAEMFAPIIQEIMEQTTKLPGVTLKAPPEISNNWRDGH